MQIGTKSSECISLPTEQAPNFTGWRNLEVNINHSLWRDANNNRRHTMKHKLAT